MVNTRTDEMKALQLILIEQAKSNTAEAKTEEVKIKKLKGVVRIHCTDSSAAWEISEAAEWNTTLKMWWKWRVR